MSTGSPPTWFLVAVGLICAGTCVLAARAPEPSWRASRGIDTPVRVVRHGCDSRVVRPALLVAADAWAEVERLVPGPMRWPHPLHPLHLHTSETSFGRAAEVIPESRRPGLLGFASPRGAHVALGRAAQPGAVRREGLTADQRAVIAHEVAHLAHFASLRDGARPPRWVSEGLAMLVAGRLAEREVGEFSYRAVPSWAEREEIVYVLMDLDRLPTVAEICADRVGELGRDSRYAVWWMFFRFLALAYPEVLTSALDDRSWQPGGARPCAPQTIPMIDLSFDIWLRRRDSLLDRGE